MINTICQKLETTKLGNNKHIQSNHLRVGFHIGRLPTKFYWTRRFYQVKSIFLPESSGRATFMETNPLHTNHRPKS